MIPKVFESRWDRIGWIKQYDEKAIKNEPMFYGAHPLYAYLRGGPITRNFLRKIPIKYLLHGIFDSRVHMLMPGWYPCIPGWHHDDVIRTLRRNGQPDYKAQYPKAEHIMSAVSFPRNVAMPEMLQGYIHLTDPDKLDKVYKSFNSEIEASYLDWRCRLESSEVVKFDSDTFHRGMKAEKNCWRWFGRVTINKSNKLRTYANEIRRQVNVYLPAVDEGW